MLIGMALCILSTDEAVGERESVAHSPDLTLKGQVGRALADRGMQVSLNVLDMNERAFDVYAEIAIVNPAYRERGIVRVADDGLICWRGQVRGTDDDSGGIDLDEVTKTLTRTLAAAGSAPVSR